LFQTHQVLVSHAPSFCFKRTKSLFLTHQVFVSNAPSGLVRVKQETGGVLFQTHQKLPPTRQANSSLCYSSKTENPRTLQDLGGLLSCPWEAPEKSKSEVIGMGDYVDFKALKLAVTVEVAAARYGVELRQVNASTARGKCPLPSHPAGDDKESFSVNVEKRVWICHSAPCAKGRKGKKGGDVIELVSAMEGCSLREAGVKLGAWLAGSGESPAPVDEPVGESAGAPEPRAPSPVQAEANGAASDGYGVYAPLAEWVEEWQRNVPNDFMFADEKRWCLRVLGKIRELARQP
jgi:hypothetical protein